MVFANFRDLVEAGRIAKEVNRDDRARPKLALALDDLYLFYERRQSVAIIKLSVR